MSGQIETDHSTPRSFAEPTPSTTAYSQSPGMASSTVGEGEAFATNQAEAGSSKMPLKGDNAYHAVGLADFIFNVGYLGQNWADIQVTFFDTGLKLHRIVLARSPYLLHHMLSAVSGNIHLTFKDPTITAESVHIALQHLYRPSQHLVHASNSRPVLATALLFDSMPELVEHAYRNLQESISATTAVDLVNWVHQPSPPHLKNGNNGVNGVQPNGHERYGQWSARLRDDLNAFLIQTLPKQVDETQLVSTYAQLPFDLFKRCIESESLPMESTQKRFAFAKKVIASRKKAATAQQVDEAAVLAMQGNGMAVVVTRKPKKGRSFFKVEG